MKEQKNIVITGASRGIGYDTALHLAQDQNNQIFVLSRNEVKLSALAQAATQQNIRVIPFDLANFDAEKLIIAFERIEQIDVLINNAGLLINEPFETLTI
ncbi:MAG: SDR family NAD(P)-dependent oxidoreductase, partial [Bacteroidota bacterium]